MPRDNSHSGDGTPSPLAFARAWQEYRAAAARTPFPDSRLLLAARFWRVHRAALHAREFSTYVHEDLPPLWAIIDKALPGDLFPEELEEVAAFLELVASGSGEPTVQASARSRTVWEKTARGWFYVGDAERALRALARAGILPDPDVSKFVGVLADSERSDAPEIPGLLAGHCAVSHPDLAPWLQRFGASWRARRETGDPRRAHCLLVEYDTQGRPVRGRIRTLQGRLAPLPSDTETDEVVFHHQVRTPDDPFVGTAYNALAALRSAGTGGMHTTGGQRYRATLSLGDRNEEIYSGNSIGLAAFAVAYADRWSGELHRDRRTIADTVAFTGGVSERGEAQPVAGESLAVKIKRAFHSSLEYVVVPESNRREAEDCAADLRKDHPCRRLRIIGIEDTTDIVADHNILRTEKLCVGEFTIRAAARLSRNVKVQVPVMLLLLYALVCVIEPRAWILFDWNPRSLVLTPKGFNVLNETGKRIRTHEFSCPHQGLASKWDLGQLDDDGNREIAFLFEPDPDEPCDSSCNLFVFDDDGTLLFTRSAVIRFQYPGDSIFPQPYNTAIVDILETEDGPIIVTGVVRSYPARAHFRSWSADGDSLAWFINAGYAGHRERYVWSANPALFYCAGYNNPCGSVCVMAFRLDSCYGASPPYQDADYDLSAVVRGNQLAYLIFPPTDFCQARGSTYNLTGPLAFDSPGIIRVNIDEFGGPRTEDSASATVSYYLDSDCNLLYARCSDRFKKERRLLVGQGVLPPVDWHDYESALADRVSRWSDSGWVSAAPVSSRASH